MSEIRNLLVLYGTDTVKKNVTSKFLEYFYAFSAKVFVIAAETHFNNYFGDVAPSVVKQLTVNFGDNSPVLIFPEITKKLFCYHMAREDTCSGKIQSLSAQFPFADYAHLVEFYESNDYLRERIESCQPFCAARLGHSEVRIIDHRDKIAAATHVGVSPPTEQEMSLFTEKYESALLDSDCCLVFDRPYFEYYLDRICPETKRVSANVTCEGLHAILFPAALQYDNFWFHSLAGKKVLLVSPLKESIPQQRDKNLFGSVAYPKFKSLEVLESPMTQTMPEDVYDGAPWSEHYARLETALASKDFDIALLGCGGYALPLASACKKLGKQAIVIGGVLQLFFGVLGERWVSRLQDLHCKIEWQNWIRPTANERPPVWRRIEGGCYW